MTQVEVEGVQDVQLEEYDVGGSGLWKWAVSEV